MHEQLSDPVIEPETDPEFEQSATITKILPAMVKMQKLLKPANRSAYNPYHKSTYADLAAVMDVLREPLADNGLCLTHQNRTAPGDDGAIIVHTRLYHESGEYFGCALKIRVDVPSKKEREAGIKAMQPTAQELGSAATYGKRYNAMALTAVVAEGEDDDGAGASKRQGDRDEDNRRPPRGDQGGGAGGGKGKGKGNRQPPPDDGPREMTAEEKVEHEAKEAMQVLGKDGMEKFTEYVKTMQKFATAAELTTFMQGLKDPAGKEEATAAFDLTMYKALKPKSSQAYRKLQKAIPADPPAKE